MIRNSAAAPSATSRFAKKREAIIAAATDVLNRQGVRGMTLAEVAAQVGLNTTSVTYYFRKKEDLAAACFLAGIERITSMIREAAQLPEPRARIAHFIELFLRRHGERRTGSGLPLVAFLDIRTLEEPHLSEVNEAFSGMVRRARDLMNDDGQPLDRKAAHARTFLLLEQVFWSVGWLNRYDVDDYPRIAARMLDVLAGGLAAESAAWPPPPQSLALPEVEAGRDSGQEAFLVASTRLINRHGYRGASVEKISAELNVTKGSFYHHNETKDELVVACFERTDALLKRVQCRAMASDSSAFARLASAVATLVAFQSSKHGPLLRTAALGALPEPMKANVLERAQRITDRFAAMISDGVSDGSIRPVDPMIAANMLKVSLSASAELDTWVKGVEHDEVVDLVARPILFGLLQR